MTLTQKVGVYYLISEYLLLMRIVITEQQFSRFSKSSPALQNGINKYLNQYIEKGNRKIGKKSRSYGNLSEDWCVDGKETISAYYYFDEGKFKSGRLDVSQEIVNDISKLYVVKSSYVLHIIEEWYEETMVPKIMEITKEPDLGIDTIYVMEKTYDCIPETVKPEGITDEEMIDFINKNTLYKRQEIIDKIDSGEKELEDFYLDILTIVNRKKITGL